MTLTRGADPVSHAVVTVTRLVCGIPERTVRRRLEALAARAEAATSDVTGVAGAVVEGLERLTASLSASPAARHTAQRVTRAAADHLEHTHATLAPPQVHALEDLLADVELQVARRASAPPDVRPPHHLPPRQLASWTALLEVAHAHPRGWSLIGGQLVAVHCWERGAVPSRPTNDGDAVLDVRASPAALSTFTEALVTLGFEGGEPTATGHEHRWRHSSDGAQIDVLIPSGTGERAAARRGAGGGTTLTTPGADHALRQSRPVRVHLEGLSGVIHRPHLAGAVLLKGTAARVPLDPGRARHLLDAAILLGVLGREDRSDLHHLLWQPDHRATARHLLEDLEAAPLAWTTERQSAARGIGVVEAVLAST